MMDQKKRLKHLVASFFVDRIERNYKDFIHHQKGFDKLAVFFREHIYIPNNKEIRDTALEKMYNQLKSVIGPKLTARLYQLIQLNELTDRLDLEIASFLAEEYLEDIDLKENFLDEEMLNKAFVQTGQVQDRIRQIALICELMGFFFSFSRVPMVGLWIKSVKAAARAVGAGPLVAPIEAGYSVSREIKDIRGFLKVFKSQEEEKLLALAGAEI